MNIQITPAPLCGVATAPTSKSAAHRALICAAFADAPGSLQIKDSSEDLIATANCLRALGAAVQSIGETWTVIPPKTLPAKATLDCGESGSTLRFLLPVAAACGVAVTCTGHGRLPQRPMQPLLEVLRAHGCTVNDGFPLRCVGRLQGGCFVIDGCMSSQFTTGLLLALPLCGRDSTLTVRPPLASGPYVDITLEILAQYGVPVVRNELQFMVPAAKYRSREYTVEGDWSNAAFWLCAGVPVRGLRLDSPQGDKKILSVLQAFGAVIRTENDLISADVSSLHGTIVDAADIPDLVPIIAAVAATAAGTTTICHAAHLRFKESDRIRTTVQMLRALGADAEETDDGLRITGVPRLSGGVVDGCGDHRIVMAAAIAALRCTSPVTICGAQAVNKSYPRFFEEYSRLGGLVHVL